MEKFDAIIIGTGQAGPSMAMKCAGKGLKTAIIERKRFGGACVNTGCTPTKTMVASAKAIHTAMQVEDYGGILPGDIEVDMKKIKGRKYKIVKESSEGLEKALKETDNLTVIEGHARFNDNKTIQVNDRSLQAEKIFINVGGRPKIPEALQNVPHLTNATIMELESVPEHLVIVGGGYVSLEFAQMFRRFGSKVTIVERGKHLVKHEDEDVCKEIENILKNEGINLRLGADCISGKSIDGSIEISVECEEGEPSVKGSHLLVAAGRQPNTDDLGIEITEIKMDENGFIEVNEKLGTSVKGIWALGDCNGEGAFTHTAYNDYEVAAANIFDNANRSIKDRILCYALYIDPPLARIGMTEREVRESDKKGLIATRPMTKIARAKEKGETQGFMKILVDEESKEILGASILGVGGDEVIHSLLDVMYTKKPYTVIENAVHIHPTLSELIPTTLSTLEPLE